MRNFLAQMLIVCGIIFLTLAGYLIIERYVPKTTQKSYAKAIVKNQTKDESRSPVRVIIDDLNIDLPIFSAEINNGQWQTTSEGASYLASSPLPGNLGNSVIYAHNWYSLFGKLVNAKPKENIKIFFKDGISKDFTIAYTAIVPANQTHIIDPSYDRRITLYTCTGFLDSQRFVVVAILNK